VNDYLAGITEVELDADSRYDDDATEEPRLVPPVKRVDTLRRGKPTHHYVDGTGERIDGVTKLLGDGLPKPWLTPWSVKVASEYAVNEWATLDKLDPFARLAAIKAAPYAIVNAAAKRGTEVHRIAEQYAAGEAVEYDPALTGYVEAAIRFQHEWQPDILLAEVTVYNLDLGYAGTLDLIAKLPDGRIALLDYKTSRAIYPETGAQLAAYRYATHYLDADGKAQPMPAVDWCGAVHIRADGFGVYELRADLHVLDRFLEIAAVARMRGEMDSWKTGPLTNPSEVAF
jgi:hypothetical protein